MDTLAFLRVIERFGFKAALTIPFKGHFVLPDNLYIYFLEKYGILLEFDTYDEGVNGGNFYYEWIPHDFKRDHYKVTSTGGFEKIYHNPRYADGTRVWVGQHDCRENIKEKIEGLAEKGTFITPWISDSNIIRPKFVHYMDHHIEGGTWDEGYEKYKNAINNQGRDRYNMLPSKVKNAIGIAFGDSPVNVIPIKEKTRFELLEIV